MTPDSADDAETERARWFAAPDDTCRAMDVPVEMLVDAALEAEVWALDARLARAESAA